VTDRRYKGVVSRSELIQILKDAHTYCKQQIPLRPAKKGLRRERSKYLNCIREYIRKKIAERAKAMGLNVEGV